MSVLPAKRGIDDRDFVPRDKFCNLEQPEAEEKVPLEIKPSTIPEEGQIPEEKRPPRVLVPLSDQVIEELMPVVLNT